VLCVIGESVYGGGIVKEGVLFRLVGVECSHGSVRSVCPRGAGGRSWAAMLK
jgi:hypothetical protein